MADKYRLSHQQRLLQKMSLTPQMRQSIQLLSMSVKDLSEYIDSVISNNPFLQKIIENKAHKDHKLGRSLASDKDISDYDQQIKDKRNPRLDLLSQAKMLGLEDKDLDIIEYLIFELDENGYITTDLEEAAETFSTTIDKVEKNLEVLQGMDPAGIGARDIGECLKLQLKRQKKEGSLEYKIVGSFLTELARNDTREISKALDIDEKQAREAINNIKKLNPRPASTMLSKESENIIPELIAHVEKNKIRLEINRGVLPNLKLYNPYENNLDIIKDDEARKFLKENLDYAKGLIDNLKRRESTLCDVANYILNFQRNVLTKDQHDLKTLTIKEVADALGFHPSTISRAIANKYIQVKDKAIPLKSLLSHGIKKENGDIASKTSVKKKIEALIKNENKASPLSDSTIQELLEKEGIKIARRTIVKYRKALKILPTYLRKNKKPEK